MKILITSPIIPPEIGGPATYVSQLAGSLARKHGVTIITFTKSPISISGVNIVSIPQFNFPLGSFFRQVSLLLQLAKHLPQSDLVYCQGPIVVGVATTLVAKLFHKPLLLKFVGDIPWETAQLNHHTNKSLEGFYRSPLTSKYSILNRFQESSLHLADIVITPSNYLKTFLTKHHGLKPNKITVISNAISVNSNTVSKLSNQLIYVGRLVPWKNVDQIIEAVSIARRQKPWKLLIVGIGPDKPKLLETTKKHQASSWVEFAGVLSKPKTQEQIARSQGLILYSLYEGQPHVIIEALTLGTKVIVSDIKPNREILRQNGQYAPLHSPNALATQIKLLDNHPPARSLKLFSWADHLAHLERLFLSAKK